MTEHNLTVINASLTATGLNMPVPRLFWNGVELTAVREFVCHNRCEVDDDPMIRIKVDAAVTGFAAIYAEMTALGIHIKQGG